MRIREQHPDHRHRRARHCDGTGAAAWASRPARRSSSNEERIAWIGPAHSPPPADRQVDLGGRTVIPGFVDSHTHLVFAGDRSAEFVARMAGEQYDGGGIASTVAATRSPPPTSSPRW